MFRPLPRSPLMALCAVPLLLVAACGDDAPSDAATTPGGSGRADTGVTNPNPPGDALDGPDSDSDSPGPTDGIPCDLRPCDEQPNGGLDNDADGDGIPDCIEGGEDADGDGVPNCLDLDSDGDGILDFYEGWDDVDGDGIPNFLDLDSDGDGWPDSVEYGRPANSEPGPPIDRDGDGVPDFLDLDSDGDGLPDADEQGCPTSTERTRFDSDGDGISDLLEVTFGSDPCDPTSDLTGLVDFYFVLPYQGDRARGVLDFGTDLRLGDVVFNVDTTGSMQSPINALRDGLSSEIIPALRDEIPDVAFGVSAFDDFPCNGHGSGNDVPFRLIQRVTTDANAAQNAVANGLNLHNGADIPESGLESIYQLATGAGTDDCQTGIVPPFNPLQNLVGGVAEGVVGGAGFRRGAAPIVVHITDAVSHARGENGYAYGATRAQTWEAVRALGMRVVGIAVGSDAGARNDLSNFAQESNARVPVCAFDAVRGPSCAAGQCCTGPSGSGRAPVGGQCPLNYELGSGVRDLAASVVAGISALINYAPLDITTVVRGDPDELRRSGINTACFIDAVVPDAALGTGQACSVTPERADFNNDGQEDGFRNVAPGSRVIFDVRGYNNCVPGRPIPQTFIAYVDVVSGSNLVLDTRIVTIVVPPALKD